MNRKESALVCILFFIYPSEDIVYICDKIDCLKPDLVTNDNL